MITPYHTLTHTHSHPYAHTQDFFKSVGSQMHSASATVAKKYYSDCHAETLSLSIAKHTLGAALLIILL